MSQPETFETTCFHCHASFDAFQGRWCDCVVRESSVVCTQCGHCSCKAPAAYKAELWRDAPTYLLSNRFRGLRADNVRALEANTAATTNEGPLVLVIDDSRAVRGAARVALEDAGYRVTEAADAVEGLRLVHEQRPALVLSDALMPRLDGREMCRIIKSDPRTSGVRVVLMTALYTAARYRTEALRCFRADDYLAKPVTAERLLEVIAKALFGQSLPLAGTEALQAGAA